MAKTVYSIVLDDEVVRAVDALAGSQGLSRSAAINRILAQHVQMDTAEQRIQDVFAVLEQMAQGSALQLLSVTPEGGRPMDGTAWAAGRRLKAGDCL